MSDANDQFMLAYCGLVCSQCGMFRRDRCPGCHGDRRINRNCKVERCCLERQIGSCAECTDFDDLRDCRKLNNLISKVFSFIFRSDRIGNLNRIREVGLEKFKQEVTA